MRKPWPTPELLRSLLQAAGPSGHEEEPARIWREAASAFAEVTSDTLGSSFARVRAGEGAITLALVGHIDEIGVAVTNIEENGLLSFDDRRRDLARDAGRPADRAPDRERARSPARSRGSASRRSRFATGRAPSSPTCTSTSARSRARRRKRSSASGDARVWNGAPVELPNGRLALDVRSTTGSAPTSRSRRRGGSPSRSEAQVDVVAVAAVQEEIGLYGARAAAFGLDPQVAIAIDVTPATDVPGRRPEARRHGSSSAWAR